MVILRRASKSMYFGIFFVLAFALFFFFIQYMPSTYLCATLNFENQQLWLGPTDSDVLNHRHLDGEHKNYFKQTLMLKGKGVISKIHGGIGNQLYLYACIYALARDTQRPLYNFVSATTLDSRRMFLPSSREFVLDKFRIPLTNLIDASTKIDKSAVTYLSDSELLFRTYPTDNTFLQLNRDSYCTSEAYWAQYKDEIITMFQFRPEVVKQFPKFVTILGKEIENSGESVAVHVRRGDFKSAWRLPISYQRDAIGNLSKMLKSRQKKQRPSESVSSPKFFIFSDDIEYCKLEFRNLTKVHNLFFVSSTDSRNGTTSLQEFFLMTKCKHFIIPNSTFGWWAAYLATNKPKNNGLLDKFSDGIVIVSENRPAFWKSNHYKNKNQINFYLNVIEKTVQFPKGWIIYHPAY